MASIAALADCLSTGAHPPRRPADPLGVELNALADLGRAASSAAVCIIAWQGQGAPALVSAPALDPRFEALGGAGLSLLANQLQAGEQNSAKLFKVTGPELALRLGRTVAAPALELTAASGSDESTAAIAILMAEPARRGPKLEAILQLLVRAALGVIAAGRSSRSRDFWKERANAATAALRDLNRKSTESEAEHRRIDDAVAEAWKLAGSGLPAGVGRLVASVGPFDAWIVALCGGPSLRIEASSAQIREEAAGLTLDGRSALVESISRRAPILKSAAEAGARYHEDRVFAAGGFSFYFCLPFDSGAIALAARGAIGPAAAGRAQTLLDRIAPVIKVWMLEREAGARRGLVQSLAFRLFGAIDAERARIARDLHDDQAQLLTAARIALTARRAKANRILGELEQRLRVKLRALRPATLGRATLRTALEAEVRRLLDAGIEARLLKVEGVRRLKRPVQDVCYQVAREAISNIIRHSGARRVEISLNRAGDCARLSISDDGRGIGKRSARGMGLSGLAERVELIGGSLKVESRRGSTCVVAEIPAPLPSRGSRKRNGTS